MINKIKITLASLLLVVLGTQTSLAQGLTASDMSFAFGNTSPGASQYTQQFTPMPLMLSAQEMEATEGEALWFAPLAWTGVRIAITGFTRHGLNQAINRGVTPGSIANTLRNPGAGSRSFISGRNAGTTQWRGQTSTVVTNRSDQIVSTWRTNPSRFRGF